MSRLRTLTESVINGDEEAVVKLVRQLLAEGIGATEILNEGLIPAMNVVGDRMKKHEIFLPEVLLSASAMKAGLEVLKPLLTAGGASLGPKIILGTVKGDLHDIGKNLVGMMLTGAGFQVIDLGIDVPAEKFAEAIREEKPAIVGMSALLTTTMPEMKTTIDALEAASLRRKVKVIVGGAPVTAEYATRIGADGYAPNAALAVDLVRQLVQ